MAQGAKYYGGFFWLAAISFIVPFFVGVNAFKAAAPTTKPKPVPDVSGVDHAIWDYLLKAYVADGLIDYDGMKRDHLFKEYLRQLGSAKPELLESDADRLALMCNAYNAFVVNGVITHKIRGSVMDYKKDNVGFFDVREHIFAGETISLNFLEHETIRPTFQEPRIHVALVCAARSCPALRAEAFTGDRVDQQLQDQSKLFANNSDHVSFNSDSNKIELNPILKWYGQDWDKLFPAGGYLHWIAELVEDENLKSKLEAAIAGKVETNFVKYDWSLNSQSEPGANSGHSSGEFGSGSIQTE